jgi:hypothetical protein
MLPGVALLVAQLTPTLSPAVRAVIVTVVPTIFKARLNEPLTNTATEFAKGVEPRVMTLLPVLAAVASPAPKKIEPPSVPFDAAVTRPLASTVRFVLV